MLTEHEVPKPQLACDCIPEKHKKKIEKLALRAVDDHLRRLYPHGLNKDTRPKETGHNTSGQVESLTRESIRAGKYNVQACSKTRNSEDFFVTIEDILYGFNSKLSFVDQLKSGKFKYGQPNLGSLTRIFYNFVVKKRYEHYLALYTTVFVALDGSFVTTANLVDILSYPHLLYANLGTGQCMTKQAAMYNHPGHPIKTLKERREKIKKIRSVTSRSGVERRIFQSMVDQIELNLLEIGVKSKLPEVDTLVLRQCRYYNDFKTGASKQWSILQEIHKKHNLKAGMRPYEIVCFDTRK